MGIQSTPCPIDELCDSKTSQWAYNPHLALSTNFATANESIGIQSTTCPIDELCDSKTSQWCFRQ
ncbi:MAG: hypothetical protein J6V23_01305 [Bacteroidaceae bacterium]|nr:hypothetical protein [Bacteroidaceae bacterium]